MSNSVLQHDASEPARRPFQFSLRAMLMAVAACAVLFAIMHQVGPLWSVAIAWFLMLAAAHVAGNAYATRARRAPGDLSRDNFSSENEADPRPKCTATGTERDFAPATRLRQSTRLGWLMFTLTGLGAIVGCIGGVTLLSLVTWDHIGASGVIVGGISCAVLGALLGFLTSTFLGVFLRAWHEAAYEPRRPKAVKRRR